MVARRVAFGFISFEFPVGLIVPAEKAVHNVLVLYAN